MLQAAVSPVGKCVRIDPENAITANRINVNISFTILICQLFFIVPSALFASYTHLLWSFGANFEL